MVAIYGQFVDGVTYLELMAQDCKTNDFVQLEVWSYPFFLLMVVTQVEQWWKHHLAH